MSLQYFSRSSLRRVAGVSCRIFLSYRLQVVTHEVYRSSLRRLICLAQDHLIFLTSLIISITFVPSLTQMLDFLSLYVMLNTSCSVHPFLLLCSSIQFICLQLKFRTSQNLFIYLRQTGLPSSEQPLLTAIGACSIHQVAPSMHSFPLNCPDQSCWL